MVSFLLSESARKTLETLMFEYRKKIYHHFTKTDVFELAIFYLSENTEESHIKKLLKKFISNKADAGKKEKK